MKSIRFESLGEPSTVLRCVQTDPPVPKHGEVLVRMLASPVNPSDLMYVRGRYTTAPRLPASPGFEGVGIVESSGGGLRGRFFRGKRVVVLNRVGGNWSEYVVVPSHQVIPISAALPVEQAATFFVNPATAWVMTQEVLRVPPGGWLLQTAAASSLGRMIIRLGKHRGFRTFNVVRRESQVAALKALGADHVEVFDGPSGTVDALRQSIQQVTGMDGVLYAVDAVGGETASAVLSCLARKGHMLVYGTLSSAPMQFSPRTMMTVGSRLDGFWLGNFMTEVSLPFKLRLVRRITQLIQQGILATTIRGTYALDDVCTAVAEAERPDQEGKILIRMNP
jgi:NADPH:quinone reductase